ncbi:DrmE family protein [Alkaliphilus hydrothermalis]|uniref:DISARM protein DrmE C-terminal domain-containing protein n=1 Tax=Alkaliphilus hydrothermalis TaxID=1482730 RepID=A0ABS2NRM3_9FIRM|nr:DrmE family protein [Alkaliphilus hydrothermalis]MBM7615615.1 hypothetical protein [Alkaliphilus hydrothermalis]
MFSEFSEIFNKIRFSYDGLDYPLNQTEKLIIQDLIIRNIETHAEDKNQIVLYPTALPLILFVISVLPLFLLKRDMDTNTFDINKALKINDKIKYNGCLGEYSGIYEFKFNGTKEKKIKIRFKDIDISISLRDAWKINKYDGDAKEINNYKPKPSKQKRTKKFLSELFDIDQNEIPIIYQSDILVVMNKRDVIEIYTKLTINNMPLNTIFPAAYFSSFDNFERIGCDDLQREPRVLFCSNLNVAEEIINMRNSVKALLIHGLNKTAGNISSLDNIMSNKSIGSIAIIEDLHKYNIENITNLVNLNFKLQTYSVDLLRNIDESIVTGKINNTINYFARSKESIRIFAQSQQHKINIIDESAELIKSIYQLLNRVKKNNSKNVHQEKYIIKVYRLLMQMRLLPVTLSYLSENDFPNEFNGAIKYLQELRIFMYSFVDSDIFETTGEIINLLEKVQDMYFQYHPKESVVLNKYREFKNNDVIVCSNKTHQLILKHKLKGVYPYGMAKVLTLNELLKSDKLYDKVIFTGLYGEKLERAFLKPGIREYRTICYEEEAKFLDYFIKKRSDFFVKQSEMIGIVDEVAAVRDNDIEFEDSIYTYRTDDIINAIKDFAITENSYNNENKIYEAFPVELEDDYIAFLTDGFRCRIFDYNKKTIKKKKVKDLEIGDEIIFSKDSKEDIFEKVIDTLKEASQDIKEKSELVKVWRQALIRYSNENNLSLEELHRKLMETGCTRGFETVKWWMNSNDCICPDDQVLYNILELTNDQDLKENILDVIRSGKLIRALHVKIGKILASRIAHSLTAEEINEDPLFDQIQEDLSKHAHAVIVKKIHLHSVSIPASQVNRLIDRENY